MTTIRRSEGKQIACGKIVLTYKAETIADSAELIREVQALVVELVTEAMGKVPAEVVAAAQGEAAAEIVLSENLREAASQLGLRDRRLAPLRRVTRNNGRGKTVSLECGHKFTIPSGHSRKTKRRRCIECVAEAR
jgi:hypothetical protein